MALSSQMKHTNTLDRLDKTILGYTPTGAAALGKALETNTALEKIYMNENEVGPEGARALMAGLKAKLAGLRQVVDNDDDEEGDEFD